MKYFNYMHQIDSAGIILENKISMSNKVIHWLSTQKLLSLDTLFREYVFLPLHPITDYALTDNNSD